MTFNKSLNPTEPQNKLLTKSSNFLNNQNYILGKSEKKKVLSIFLGTKILKKVLGYTGIFYSILLISIGLFSINYGIILISSLFIFLGIILIIKYENFKINTFKEIFISKNTNNLNHIFFIFFYTIVCTLIGVFIFGYLENYLGQLIIPFLLIYFIFALFLSVKLEFMKKINFINFLFFPIIFPLFFMIYVLFYIFSTFQKYKLLKLNSTNLSLLNFIEYNGTYSSGFYEISKK